MRPAALVGSMDVAGMLPANEHATVTIIKEITNIHPSQPNQWSTK